MKHFFHVEMQGIEFLKSSLESEGFRFIQNQNWQVLVMKDSERFLNILKHFETF